MQSEQLCDTYPAAGQLSKATYAYDRAIEDTRIPVLALNLAYAYALDGQTTEVEKEL